MTEREKIYREFTSVIDSQEYMEDDPGAKKKKEELQKRLDDLDRGRLSPRQRLHAEIAEQIEKDGK